MRRLNEARYFCHGATANQNDVWRFEPACWLRGKFDAKLNKRTKHEAFIP